MWWRSVVNRSFFLPLAAFLTRSSPGNTPFRVCARCVLCWFAFPSAPALGSTGSAADCSALFVGFSATMAGSDFSRPFVIGYGSSPSRCGPPAPPDGGREISRFPCKERARMPGSSTTQGRSGTRLAHPPYCLPPQERRRRPWTTHFRGSMAGLRAPLSTLRHALAGRRRMTRGQCGVLDLHCKGLAPSTPCRSPDAFSWPGLDPAIHAFPGPLEDVDARHKATAVRFREIGCEAADHLS